MQDADLETADQEPIDRQKLLFLTAIFEGGLLLLALGLGWVFGTPALALLEPSWPATGWGVLAAVLLFVVLWVILKISWKPLVRLRQILDQVAGWMFAECTVLDLAIISILAGVCEEAFFRGFLQTALVPALGAWTALAVASIVFGLVHAVSVAYAVGATLIGALLGWQLLYFDNLWVPIVAHTAYDFLVLVYLTRLKRPMAATPGQS